MVMDFTKKPFPDYSFAILLCSFMTSEGNPLTAATMASNTDSREESDVSLDIFQSLSQRDAAESGEESQLSSDGRAHMLRRADGHLIRPESIFGYARVNKHESYRTTRTQNEQNIRIFQK
ncbi:hypothetical protein AMECASPLE_031837 [Ameca splendens]|uniref:Uncharacterized protein n=1 Tax=Ameca splendens TaxID=208324 RepID=A0ABV0ZF77_9TELE